MESGGRFARMRFVQAYFRRKFPVAVGALALSCVAALLIADASPGLVRAAVHDVLATLPLVLTAAACLLVQAARRSRPVEWAKAVALALAFFFWAASQICVCRGTSMLFNDLAIALFVLDVFLAIAAPHPASHEA
jgi:hypothetical protein